jgi:putative iron-dependent peroxidase
MSVESRSRGADAQVAADGRSCPAPQAVLETLTPSATFLVVTIGQGGEAQARQLLMDLDGLTRSVRSRAPEGRLSCVVGVGSDAWDRLFTGPRPAELHEFPELVGRKRAVSTPGDLLFHVRATRSDLCFELVAEVMSRLRNVVTVRDEVVGFEYFEGRNLLGFVDGTENPVGEAVCTAVLVGEEDRAFAGGAYVVVQKYLHDLNAWTALSVEEQERVIGRSKAANIEQDEAGQAPDSHVALNKVIAPDGTERQILRDNMPFGSAAHGEYGTYFIGYTRTPSVIEQMLSNMFLGTASADSDRILDFSEAVTGTLFFAPSATFLDDPPELPKATAGVAPASTPSATGTGQAGSLNIGGLRRSPNP